MNNEIKEILEEPKILMLSYGNYISIDDYVKLKDYITNLQEENEKLKELCNKYEEEHNTTFNYWKQLIKEDYKLRCEKAIKYIQNKIEESKNLQDYSKWYVENYDKAIDSTNSSHSGIMLETIKSTTIKRYEDILNILKGE